MEACSKATESLTARRSRYRLALAIAVNLALYGWLGALGAWSGKEAHASDRLVHLLIAGAFTVLTAGVWYALSFEVGPFE